MTARGGSAGSDAIVGGDATPGGPTASVRCYVRAGFGEACPKPLGIESFTMAGLDMVNRSQAEEADAYPLATALLAAVTTITGTLQVRNVPSLPVFSAAVREAGEVVIEAGPSTTAVLLPHLVYADRLKVYSDTSMLGPSRGMDTASLSITEIALPSLRQVGGRLPAPVQLAHVLVGVGITCNGTEQKVLMTDVGAATAVHEACATIAATDKECGGSFFEVDALAAECRCLTPGDQCKVTSNNSTTLYQLVRRTGPDVGGELMVAGTSVANLALPALGAVGRLVVEDNHRLLSLALPALHKTTRGGVWVARNNVLDVLAMPALTALGQAGTCPHGYTAQTGHVVGDGHATVGGATRGVPDVRSCGNLCSSNAKCLSFEYSPSEQACERNIIASPDSADDKDDFVLCVRHDREETPGSRFTAAFQASGCPSDDIAKLVPEWRGSQDADTFDTMHAYCAGTASGTGTEEQKRVCCGDAYPCKPARCAKLTAFPTAGAYVPASRWNVASPMTCRDLGNAKLTRVSVDDCKASCLAQRWCQGFVFAPGDGAEDSTVLPTTTTTTTTTTQHTARANTYAVVWRGHNTLPMYGLRSCTPPSQGLFFYPLPHPPNARAFSY